MSRYQVNRVLWEVARSGEVAEAFAADPGAVLADRELDEAERAALQRADIRAIFVLGAHPFLLYSFALRVHGSWSFQFMVDYVAQIEDLDLIDIST
jgi:hypothetical protein